MSSHVDSPSEEPERDLVLTDGDETTLAPVSASYDSPAEQAERAAEAEVVEEAQELVDEAEDADEAVEEAQELVDEAEDADEAVESAEEVVTEEIAEELAEEEEVVDAAEALVEAEALLEVQEATETAAEVPAEEEPVEVDPTEELRAALKRADGEWYVVHSYAGYENKVKTNLETRIKSLDMEEYIF